MPPSRNGVTNAVNVPRNIFKPQIYTDETQMRRESDLKPVNIRVHPWLIHLDCSLKVKFCRAGERDVREPSGNHFKANLQFVTAARENSDRLLATFSRSEDQCARDYSGSAGKRFVFHAAFVRADGDFSGTAFLDE